MADKKQLKNAKLVFDTLCETLDDRKWRYDKHLEDLCVTFSVSGDDIPMEFIVAIDAERDLVRLMSLLPFKFSEQKRVEGAIATCQANFRLADGSFDYNFKNGAVVFRMTSSFKDSLISKELFEYMVGCACYTVDEFNDQFLMIDKGMLSIEDFFKKK